MLRKSTLREIKSSLARYLAIFAIVALGVGFFAGLKDCKASMVNEARDYLDKTNMYDYQILSSYGIDEDSVAKALAFDGVKEAEPSKQIDVLAVSGDDENNEEILKCISLPQTINKVSIVEGRMPKSEDECLVDVRTLSGGMYKIGGTIQLADSNDEDTLNSLKVKKYKVVGKISTPLYLDYQRGSSSIGNGSIDSFFYVQESVFDTDYYTNLYITLDGNELDFSSEDEAKLDKFEDKMEALAEDITYARREIAREKAQKILNEKRREYQKGLSEFNRNKKKAYKGIADAQEQINSGRGTISDKKEELTSLRASLVSQREDFQKNVNRLNSSIQVLEKAGLSKGILCRALKELRDSYLEVVEYYDGLISDIDNGLEVVFSNEKDLDAGSRELAAYKNKLDKVFSKAKKKLDDASAKLDEAQRKIDEMETGNSYALSKDENAGYSSFDSNSSIVSNIAKVFPIFFFLVAALVCMTTMTRMIDEQRTQIGILKALGYSNKSILGKYMFYSGSGALLGAIFGFFVGCKVFPMVIWHAYTMMYDFSDSVPFVFDWKLLVLSLAATMLCSMGATWVSCSADFKVSPAELIRPKTPKAGKRILLERIQPIWNKLSFLYKVSMRNIFRYKKRFFMMVLGVSGCTALLIAGIGINTTISRVAEYQFGEISLYDYQIMFNKDMTETRQEEFIDYANEETEGRFGELIFLHSASLDVYKEKKNIEATCIATDSKDFDKFVDIHDGDRKIAYPGDGECVIVRKIQKELGIDVGDTITLKEGYYNMNVKVVDVCDYYVGEVIFMNTATYTAGMGISPETKTAFVLAPEGNSDEEVRAVATACGQYEDAAASIVNIDTLDVVDTMMDSLKAIIFVVILCAGLLAFIVLFNLTNINITERIREIATIKVLGFTPAETSQYVFRENLFLTGIAAIVGIPLGKWLLKFVIDNIVVSMIYFEPRLNFIDYVMAVALTFVFALIVSLAMQKRLKNISMTESLKSIE